MAIVVYKQRKQYCVPRECLNSEIALERFRNPTRKVSTREVFNRMKYTDWGLRITFPSGERYYVK